MPRFWIGPAGSLTDAQADARPSNAAALPPCALALALACALSAFPAAAQNPNNTGGTQVTDKQSNAAAELDPDNTGGAQVTGDLERTGAPAYESRDPQKPCGAHWPPPTHLASEVEKPLDLCDKPLTSFTDSSRGAVIVQGPNGISLVMTPSAAAQSAKDLADAATRAGADPWRAERSPSDR